MTEGEFKKRLIKKGYFLTDTDYMDFMEILDEAKKEFPKLTVKIEKQYPNHWPQYLNDQKLQWFKKWFENEI